MQTVQAPGARSSHMQQMLPGLYWAATYMGSLLAD